MNRTLREEASLQAVAAGVTAALLGYASSVAVVVAGLTAVGATQRQVTSALLALGVAVGVLSIAGSLRYRLPVAVVWTTPGVALLATTGPVEGGVPAVVGAFLLCGLLVVLTGLVRPLASALQRLPAALSGAVLAGVLLPFCLAPVRAVAELPLEAGAIALTWLVALRVAPKLAGPLALAALLVVVAVDGQLATPDQVVPQLEVVAPALTLEAVTSLALPLYLVTMAAQNLVGLAVLQSQGYRPPVRALLVGTGGGSMAIAPFLGPTVNLAAITGILTAGPTVHADPARRWVAGVTGGLTMLLLGALAPLTSAIVTGSDPRLVATAAGLALVGAFAGAAESALRDERTRVAAAVTLLVAGSGVTAGVLSAAPLALVAGAAVLLVTRTRIAGRHAASAVRVDRDHGSVPAPVDADAGDAAVAQRVLEPASLVLRDEQALDAAPQRPGVGVAAQEGPASGSVDARRPTPPEVAPPDRDEGHEHRPAR